MQIDESSDQGGLPFVAECIRYLRKVDMLTAPTFDDPAAIYKTLSEKFEISDPIFATEKGRTFALLLTLDPSLAVQVPLREMHDHQDHAAQILATFAKDVQITKSVNADFVTLNVTGQLHASLSQDEARSFDVTQTFASGWRYLDYFMIQQLLKKILQVQIGHLRETVGQDEETSVLIFCVEPAQHKAIEAFENLNFEDYERSVRLDPVCIPNLPELDKNNIADIYEKLHLNDVREKDIDQALLFDLAAEYAALEIVKPSTSDKLIDRLSILLYVLAGLYALRVVLLLVFDLGVDWPI